MATTYPLTFTIVLGASYTGLTLSAQLINNLGALVGPAVTTGFTEIGGGFYIWNATIPSGFQGSVVFTNTATLQVMTLTDINPQIDENSLDLIQIEPGVNARQALSVVGAVLAGVLVGNCPTGNVMISGMNNISTIRVTALTANGQRTAVVLNLPS